MTSGAFEHPREIAARLQREVDLILQNIDDRQLFAEFSEIDIVDIHEGNNHPIMREALDERIYYNMNARPEYEPLIERSVRHSKSFHTTIVKILNWLFKPFHLFA